MVSYSAVTDEKQVWSSSVPPFPLWLNTLQMFSFTVCWSFYPQPCPARLSVDSLQFPTVLLSQWRIRGGSIKGKQGGIHSVACICSPYLFAMANPCELEDAEDLLDGNMWGTCSAIFFVLLFTLSKQQHIAIILWAFILNSAHIIALSFHFEIKHSPRKV